MTEPNADTHNPFEQEGGVPAAGAQEQDISIPKWRFDQLAHENRALKEDMRQTKELLNTLAANRQPQQKEPEIDLEQLGLDPQVAQAVKLLAQQELKKIVEPQAQRLQHQAGMAFKKAEHAEFLMTQAGEDPKRLKFLKQQLPRIEEYRQRALREQGVPLSLDYAWKFLRLEDQERQPPRAHQPAPQHHAPAQQPQPQRQMQVPPAQRQVQVQEPQEFDDYGYPNPAATRFHPGSAGNGSQMAPQGKSFEEMTAEEMESALEEQGFKQGFTL
jgi:hypothetical protein